MLIILDDYTRYSVVVPLILKSDAAMAIRVNIARLENIADTKVKNMRSDRGGKFCTNILGDYYLKKGIKHEMTVGYSSPSNGRAERRIRTLVDNARTNLAASGLPPELWAEALVCGNVLKNFSPTEGESATPYERLFKKKPDVSHLRVFGSTAWVHKGGVRTSKLKARAKEGIFVGYAFSEKAYRVLVDGHVIVSRDVEFVEKLSTGSDRAAVIRKIADPTPVNTDLGEDEDIEDAFDSDDEIETATPPAVTPGAQGRYPSRTRASPQRLVNEDPSQSHVITGRRPITALATIDESPQIVALATIEGSPQVPIPSTYEEATSGPQAKLWEGAVLDELTALNEYGTYNETTLPPDKKAISTGWVFDTKKDERGNISRFKARMVAKGFLQKKGIDYDEVFAATSSKTSLRTVLALAAVLRYLVDQYDVKSAFLNGELEEEVYIKPPPGYKAAAGTVLLLHKALYGLKQAPRAWSKKLRTELKTIGFEPTLADAAVYTRTKDTTEILVTHVDDFLTLTPTAKASAELKKDILSLFHVRYLGVPTKFIGFDVKIDSALGTIKISQEQTIKDLAARFDLLTAKPRIIPLSTAEKLTCEGEPLDIERYPYSSLVGGLIWISTSTRPDIAYAVGSLARYMSAPTAQHWETAKNVVRYLTGTSSYGIVYGGKPFEPLKPIVLDGFSDADYGGDTDSRRSTTGYVFTLNGSAISWSSKRQSTIAVSTTEAEVQAATAAVQEGLWIKMLFDDFKIDMPTVNLGMDNQSAIKVIKNPLSSARTKHIDIKQHFVRERIDRNEVQLEYVSTTEMLADPLTKALPAPKFREHRANMGVC